MLHQLKNSALRVTITTIAMIGILVIVVSALPSASAAASAAVNHKQSSSLPCSDPTSTEYGKVPCGEDTDSDSDDESEGGVKGGCECNCEKLRYAKRKCKYNKQLCKTELNATKEDVNTMREAKRRCDASVQQMITDRANRDKSDEEWRRIMRARAEACAPRNETEKVWVDKQIKCLEEKYECIRERRDREIGLRDCMAKNDAQTATFNQPIPLSVSVSGDATATTATTVLSGETIGAEWKWPKVSVLCPVCVKRHRWLPNMYAMFKHQNYPGELVCISITHSVHICYQCVGLLD